MRRVQMVGIVLLFAAAWAAIIAVLLAIGKTSNPTRDVNVTPVHIENRPTFGADESRPIQRTHVNRTREELIAELGEPTKEGPWGIGRQPFDDEKHKGYKTLEWHWESGRFLASIYPVVGNWFCFYSCWVPKGIEVD